MAKRSADKSRSILRRLAAEERERRALELYIKGKKFADIGDALDVTEGAAWKIVHRGLARRAEQEGPTVEAARVLYTARIEHVMSALMPLADGSARDKTDPVTGEVTERGWGNVRAAEILLRYLERWGEVNGVRAAIPKGDGPDSPDNPELATGPMSPQQAAIQVNVVLQQLATVREKAKTIEAVRSAAGLIIDGDFDADDKPPPPPGLEIAAAGPDPTWQYIDRDRVA